MSESPQGGARATAVSVGTAETLALFIPGGSSAGAVSIDQPQVGQVGMNTLVRGVLHYTPGSATLPILRCRRGDGVAGTLVGTAQGLGGLAGNNPFCFQDLGNPNPQQGYTISVSTTTAAGTVDEIVGSFDDGT